jgi:hypothetical protein
MSHLREACLLTFGFSAFLKLLSLNEKPQKTEIRKRSSPSAGGGYDYHRSFRLQARQYLAGDATMAEVLASAEKITRASERLSALSALGRLEVWRTAHPGKIVPVPSTIFESPGRLFKVKFEADFGLLTDRGTVAIHIWNTMKPALAAGPTYAAMTLVAGAFENHDGAPGDIGVLSMREPPRLYRLSDIADQSALAAAMVDRLEEAIRGTTPPAPPPEPRPPL